jgi:hypothetical protein
MDDHRAPLGALVPLSSLLCVTRPPVGSFGASDASFCDDGWLTLRGGQTSIARPPRSRCSPIVGIARQDREPRAVLVHSLGIKLISVSVAVNDKRVKTMKGKRITARVDLRGLPKGTFAVVVSAKTMDAADGQGDAHLPDPRGGVQEKTK